MCDSTASTTTMASSTTKPMASTMPSKHTVFSEKPSRGKKQKVVTSETGTAMSGMSVARQPCRKRNTTTATSTRASKSVWMISSMDSRTGVEVSRVMEP